MSGGAQKKIKKIPGIRITPRWSFTFLYLSSTLFYSGDLHLNVEQMVINDDLMLVMHLAGEFPQIHHFYLVGHQAD